MSEVIKSIVSDYSGREGLGLTGEQLTMLDTYASMLVKTNEVMNLTNITDDEGIAVRHFIDIEYTAALAGYSLAVYGHIVLVDGELSTCERRIS